MRSNNVRTISQTYIEYVVKIFETQDICDVQKISSKFTMSAVFHFIDFRRELLMIYCSYSEISIYKYVFIIYPVCLYSICVIIVMSLVCDACTYTHIEESLYHEIGLIWDSSVSAKLINAIYWFHHEFIVLGLKTI